MNEERMVKVKKLPDGSVVQELPDGSTRAMKSQTDWSRVDAMTDEEVHAAALAAPDNPPLSEEQLKQFRRVPYAKFVRRRSGMTQEQFAATYQLPLGTLRDWEQGRTEPDKAALVLLRVIDKNPNGVQLALKSA